MPWAVCSSTLMARLGLRAGLGGALGTSARTPAPLQLDPSALGPRLLGRISAAGVGASGPPGNLPPAAPTPARGGSADWLSTMAVRDLLRPSVLWSSEGMVAVAPSVAQ